jgi:hypothetical protein
MLKAKYQTKKLHKQIKKFYAETLFVPAPSIIDLYDPECIERIIDDITLFGTNKNLIEQLRSYM